MKSKTYLLLILGVALIMGVIFFNIYNKSIPPIPQQPTVTPSKTQSFQPQTDNQAEVEVIILPKTLTPGSEAVFEVSLDTHSVELDYDLAKISRLVDDQGNIYQPLSWTGGSGGHHLTGLLTFPELSPSVRSTELKISGIGEVERTFKWNL